MAGGGLQGAMLSCTPKGCPSAPPRRRFRCPAWTGTSTRSTRLRTPSSWSSSSPATTARTPSPARIGSSSCKRTTDKGVQLVAINPNDAVNYPDDSFDKMKERAADKGFNFPYLRDESQEVARAYDAACTPDIFVFDRDRKLLYNGRIDDNWQEPENVTRRELRALLDAALRRQGRSTSSTRPRWVVRSSGSRWPASRPSRCPVARSESELDRIRHPFRIAIDRAKNPFNIGSIVRTAHSFLAKEIILIGTEPWYERAAMGMQRYENIVELPTERAFLDAAESEGWPLIAFEKDHARAGPVGGRAPGRRGAGFRQRGRRLLARHFGGRRAGRGHPDVRHQPQLPHQRGRRDRHGGMGPKVLRKRPLFVALPSRESDARLRPLWWV